MNNYESMNQSMARAQRSLRLVIVAMGPLALGCEVESTGGSTGGVGGAGGGSALQCPDGVSVVLSDYVSTQVALSGLDGEILSESLVSTASSMTDGLAFALSGDVAVPTSAPLSGDVVLLDRFGANVISWVNPRSGDVKAQLAVGTGFESNPQDYLEVDDETAWVTRFGQNASPGGEEHDDGGDILILDLEQHEISESIVIEPEDDLPPRPGPLTRVGDEVFVTLSRISADFSETGEARVLVYTTSGELKETLSLEGHKNCGKVTPSPDGTTLAIACGGAIDFKGEVEDLDQSALLMLDATARPLEILETHQAEDLLGEPLALGVSFADDDTILLSTQTPFMGSTNSRLFSLDLRSQRTRVLLEASPDEDGLGKGLVYSRVVCAPGCSETCLMADSDRGKLQILGIEDGQWGVTQEVTVEDSVGLPPVGLSEY